MKRKKEKINIDAIIYGAYAALIPFNMILNFTGSTINKSVGIVTGLVMLFIWMLRRKGLTRRQLTLFGPELLFMLYAFMSMIWTVDFDRSLMLVITLGSLFFLFVSGILRSFNTREINFIGLCMVVSCMAIMFFLVGNNAISSSRGTLVSSAGTADQNSLAANMALSGIWAFSILFEKSKGKTYRIFNLLALIMIVLGIVTTGSRGSILAIVGAMFYYVARKMPQLIKKKSFLLIVAVAIIAVYGVVDYISNNMSDVLLRRFSIEALVADGGSGRSEIWRNYWTIFTTNPIRSLVGYGYGAGAGIYSRFYGLGRVPHNVYLQMLVECGVVGFILFIYMLFRIWKVLWRSNLYLAQSMFLIVIVEFLTIGFLDNKGTWNVFMLALLMTENTAFAENG